MSRPHRAPWISFCAVALLGVIAMRPAWAQSAPAAAPSAPQFYEIETKYIFGYTEGSGIGLEGEKEVSAETATTFGKRDGRYFATQTKLEFEHTPNQFVQVEFGALVASHNISGVTDLDDRNAASFMGLFGEVRYLLIERTSSSPLSVTLSAEPNWRRIDETSGEPVTNFELEMKINADMELIKNRLYAGFNLMYEPEWTRTSEGEIERETTLGFSSALAFRIVPQVLVGAEVWYLRHYAGFDLAEFTGDAYFFGPTLYVQLSPKMFFTAAWNAQIAGSEAGMPSALNLADFPRHRAKAKLALEF